MLSALLDDADQRKASSISFGDAMSIRLHGGAARCTPHTAIAAAALAILLSALTIGAQAITTSFTTSATNELLVTLPRWVDAVWVVMHQGLVPMLAASSIVILRAWQRVQAAVVLGALAAVITATTIVTASALWSFAEPIVEQVGNGTVTSIGAASDGARLAAGVIFVLGVAPLVDPTHRLGRMRWPLSLVGGVAAAGAAQTLLVPYAAIAALLFGLTLIQKRTHMSLMAPGVRTAPFPAAVIGLLSLGSLLVALPTAAFVLFDTYGDISVRAEGMQLVVALLSTSSLPAIAAVTLLLRPRLGPLAWAQGVAFALSAVLSVVAHLESMRPTYEPIVLTAAAFAGLATALIVAATATGSLAARTTFAIAAGLAAATLANQLLPGLTALVWLLSIPLGLVSLSRVRTRDSSTDRSTDCSQKTSSKIGGALTG